MSTRAQLEGILAAKRTQRAHSPIHRKRGRGLVSALTVIAILFVSGAAVFFAIKMTSAKTDILATTSPSSSVSVSVSATISPSEAVPTKQVARQVCTNIPDGRLHVRFTAGNGGEVRGYLTEGEPVQVALEPAGELESQIIKDSLWIRISFPVAGWVNAHYICELE